MPQTTIELLKKGTCSNDSDKFRTGNMINLPGAGELIITGDLHGHRRNFERATTLANLKNNPNRHIILQEIIHGGPEDSLGGCMSYKLLFDIVRYKLNFPDQVHIIMGNHDTAFINNADVMKDGKEMNRSMRLAIEREFHESSADIILAMKKFLFSQPLAVRSNNRIWISHSLPADNYVDKFDPNIFSRKLIDSDLIKPGSGYLLTWGRKMSQTLLDKMAQMLDVDWFVLGHQPQEQGWAQAGRNLLILASNHNHGHLLFIDLAKKYTIESLIESLVPMASLA
jgi:hypothetical protein